MLERGRASWPPAAPAHARLLPAAPASSAARRPGRGSCSVLRGGARPAARGKGAAGGHKGSMSRQGLEHIPLPYTLRIM